MRRHGFHLGKATRPVGAVLLDLDLPAGAGLPALKALTAQVPGLPVVALATTPLAPAASEAMRLGACGCIVKGLPLEWAMATIRQALADGGAVQMGKQPPNGGGRL